MTKIASAAIFLWWFFVTQPVAPFIVQGDGWRGPFLTREQ